MRSIIALCVLVVAASASLTFPKQYYLEGTFSLPYANISEPLSMHYDGVNNRARLSFYNDLDYWVYRYDLGQVYEIFVWKDRQACSLTTQKDTVMPLIPPNLADFVFISNTTIKNIPCQHYQLEQKKGDKINTYDFYAAVDAKNVAIPIRYSMMAYDTIFGYTHVHVTSYTGHIMMSMC
jgi:hypothetical protein